MGAVWVRARAELRRRRRATIGLAIVVSLLAGGGAAATSAARRADSAFPRFLQDARAAHVWVPNYTETATFEPERVGGFDGVAATEKMHLATFGFEPGDAPGSCSVDDLDGEASCVFVNGVAYEHDATSAPVERVRILRGRAPDPTRPEEVVLTHKGVEDLGLDVGDTFEPFADDDFTPELAATLREHPLVMEVVAVGLTPSSFPPQKDAGAAHVFLTPAFYRTYPLDPYQAADGMFVRLEGGHAAIPGFIRQLEGEARGALVFVTPFGDANANRQSSLQIRTVPLQILAGILAFVLLLVVGQAIARHVWVESDDAPALRALGFTPAQLSIAAALRSAVPVLLALPLIVAAVASISLVTPTGPAAIAEPAPGFQFDRGSIVLWSGATLLYAMLIAAWMAGRIVRARPDTLSHRVSVASRVAAAIGTGPAATSGLRMALDTTSRLGTPGRTTVGGLSIGVMAIVATLTFGSSLNHLLSDPRLTGVTWDVVISSDEIDFSVVAQELAALPGIDGVASLSGGISVLVDGFYTPVQAIETIEGGVGPVVLEGRAPRETNGGAPEAMLGTALMRRLDVGLDDHVSVAVPGVGTPVEVVVVGRGIVPGVADRGRLGDGIMLAPRTAQRLGQAAGLGPVAGSAALDLAPSVDTDEEVLELLFSVLEEEFYPTPLLDASDVAASADARGLNLFLTALLAAVSIATLAHGLVEAVRHRRRDLAVLKALGFRKRQVRNAVAVQATALAATSLVVAVPLGLVGGRLAWGVFADTLGVGAGPVIPFTVVLVVPAVLLVANLVALLPGRAAAGTAPATVLRAE